MFNCPEQIDGAVVLVVIRHRAGPRRCISTWRPGLHWFFFVVEDNHRPWRARLRLEADDVDQPVFEPRIIADLERDKFPRSETVVGPDPGHLSIHPRAALDRKPSASSRPWVSPSTTGLDH